MVAVLLLNASYEPLAIIPKRHAISLLQRDRVTAVSHDTVTVTGFTQSIHIPTVLRLRRYVNVPRRGANWNRQGVFRRDNFQCIYCGIKTGETQNGRYLTQRDFTIDHIIPRSRGGKNTWGNTACACYACNHRKGNRTPHEAGMTLRWEPKIPRVAYLVASGDIPDAWKVYLEL